MGFYLRCAIAKVDDEVLADRIGRVAAEVFPPFVAVRRFDAPFAGVIAAYDPGQLDIVENFAAHGYPDEDAAHEDQAEGILARMGELSRAVPEVPFVYVDVDCFGGTCRYQGYAFQDGTQTHVEPFSSNAHVRLFEKLGVENPQWYFAPFTRDFMTTGTASEVSRLPVTYYVHARWDEPLRLAAMRAAMLPPPWKVTILTEQSCIVVHGERFVASLHAVD